MDLPGYISFLRAALDSLPPHHPNRADVLDELAETVLTRFGNEGDFDDLDRCISLREEALSLRPPGHPDRALALSTLACALTVRFENQGNFPDLAKGIGLHEEALSLRPPGHPGRARFLYNLATTLLIRFRNKGDLKSLARCISFHRQALALPPPEHPDRALSLTSLGNALSTRFEIKGDLGDLVECISLHREALTLFSPGHRHRYSALNSLASALLARFESKGDLKDLEECIDFRSVSLNNLATALLVRFDNKGDLKDLEKGVNLHKEALSLRPLGHPARAESLNNLACALYTRFKRKGDAEDLEMCIHFNKEALSLRPPEHPKHAGSLDNLASALFARFQSKGDLEDLDRCISFHRQALVLFPPGHPSRGKSLTNLADAVSARFENKGDLGDLAECISLHREALALFSPGHPHRTSSLSSLAGALLTRFENKGALEDLEECIVLYREALSLCPPGHPNRAASLNRLASALMARFRNKGDFEDLAMCINLQREGLNLCPPGHPSRASLLTNLANALLARFESEGESRLEDIDECVDFHKEVLSLQRPGHPGRAGSLHNLAHTLLIRFRNTGDFKDLEECISLNEEAVSLFRPGHADRTASRQNLALALYIRFVSKRDSNFSDLEQAIIHSREVLLCRSPGDETESSRPVFNHPGLLKTIIGHVLLLKAKHKALGDNDALEEMFELLEAGAQCHNALLLDKMNHAKLWSSTCLEFNRHETALKAYAHGVSLLPLLASLDLTLQQRQNVLVHAKDLSKDAVHCAINLRELETALWFLSTSRSVFWSQALQFRASFDRLDALHPDLASEFRTVTHQLQIETQQHPQADLVPVESTPSLRPYLLSRKREEIIATIRTKDGFHDFLLPPSPDVLKNAARKGPVVFLNASAFGSYALILKEDGSLSRIEIFTDFNLLKLLVATVRSLAGGVGRTDGDESDDLSGEEDRACRPRSSKSRTIQDKFRVVLSALWENVGEPVISALGLEKTTNPRRIWWCPTGLFAFLPIHAAGIYPTSPSQESNCLFDYVVSSYCSTPQDLIAPPPEPNPDFKMLVAIEPEGHHLGASGLPATRKELEKIESRIPEKDRLVARIGSKAATSGKTSILDDISTATIVHFGCHGKQNLSNALDSCLLLSEGRLTMSSLIRNCQTSTGALAYLSACETAMGDEARPDESLTLAATMQFAGFRSVVATMWVIHDEDGPIVADAFYRHLFRHGTAAPPDITDAAYALHLAVKALREQGRPFHRWVPFVHHGI
ncbi:hypothetical protein CC1G_14944 [Coprinopsis cinerea okayama7|uniref:CHAT domain-containing protein n=1 Tax=Coprinopsis cinerea (strain Okayama-7 / 130 / ATCC MYA-4618 / FGSC 9003) TaxID=240176 RepID=D6RP07_COPC7|nr:hypothetical protein CC1G_14944 [Coprinopsis cinerea okayama7\|eukprot:XP_002910613.1 hypothetical protein CC1G_14944 [Coprinopsis cinerea okayama7\